MSSILVAVSIVASVVSLIDILADISDDKTMDLSKILGVVQGVIAIVSEFDTICQNIKVVECIVSAVVTLLAVSSFTFIHGIVFRCIIHLAAVVCLCWGVHVCAHRRKAKRTAAYAPFSPLKRSY